MRLLAMYFLFISITREEKGVGGDQCSPCSCRPCPTVHRFPEHIKCVDCSRKNLVLVPSFPRNFTKNIGYLDLDSNRIRTLENGTFAGYSSLQLLYLSSNQITSISEGTLNGLQRLSKLDLYNNKISIIYDAAFSDLQSLTELYLSNNQITNIFEGTFNGLENLTYLSLAKNEITTISVGAFSDLQSLTVLYLRDNQINNISKHVFNGLQRLTRLSLYNNKISTIADDAFSDLRSLTELYLHNNQITNIYEGMFNGLERLRELHLYNNKISIIYDAAFSDLQSLTELYLSNNQITNIFEGTFNGLEKLTYLSLAKNEITTMAGGAFSDLQSLTVLYLRDNQINNISKHVFNGLQRLTRLSLYNNKISIRADDAFSDLQSLTKLLLHNNQITNIFEGTFNGLENLTYLSLSNNEITTTSGGAFSDLQSLTVLYLDNNKINNISKHVFNGLQRLTKLHLHNNNISTILDGAFSDLQSLTELYLHNNKITNIFEGTFIGLKSLAELDLSGNRIVVIPGSTFMGLQKLHTLRLRNNSIADIHEGAFSGLTKVKMFDLSKNRIEYLTIDMFKDMASLARLNLSSNNISYIQRKVFLPLGTLFHLHLKNNNFKDVPSALWTTRLSYMTVYLDKNPFNCSCKLLNDLKQLRHTVKSVQPSGSYYEERCTNITSVCEEVRNFALGMRLAHNCSGKHEDKLSFMEELKSEFAATDENLSTYRSMYCKSCGSSLRVDLPGVIVVTKIVIVLSSVEATDGNVTIAVGDKLSDTYEPCNKIPLTVPYSNGIQTIQVTCNATPSGRDVWVVMSIPPRFIFSVFGSRFGCSIDVYEIKVNGFEKNKYNLWSEWNRWGLCSATCGNGFRQRNRTCTNTTSLSCKLPGQINQRSHEEYTRESCNLEPCFQAVYQWTIGLVGGVFALTVLGIVFWYRKFKMIRYLEGLRPNPNFELDPNKTLLEQIEELPYDLHWEFPRYDIRFGVVIGEGHFGKVWLAKAKGIRAFNPRDKSDLSSRAKLSKLQDQRVHDYFTTVTESWLLGDCDTTHHYDVAIKTLKECATPKHQMDLASELKLLIYMGRNPNIVNVLASCTIRGDLWVIMEYCDNGSLKSFLSDRRKLFTPLWSKNSAKMSSEICFFDLLQMTEQLVKGVMFLHCWKVVHRDLSARNILVDENFNLKIADFGLARSENFVAPLDDILPIKWSSLESLLRHEYTTKSDIWSIAVLFWEIFSFGEVPYPGMSSKEVIQQLKEGYRMSAPDHCPDEIWNIISDCWNADPDERPNAMELFEQLDEVKVLVSSAPDGQYYGASGGEYGQTGTVEGPSLDEILEGKENMECEGEGSKAFADVHKTSTKDTVEKCGPSTISYDEYQKLERENCRLRKENQDLKTSIEGTADKIGPYMIPQEEHQELKRENYSLRNEIQHLKTSIEDTADQSGPPMIPQEEHQELKSENCRLRNENQRLKENDEYKKYKKIIEEMKPQEERSMKLERENCRLRNEIRHLKTSMEDTADKSGPCMIPQEEHQELKSENYSLRNESQRLKENEEKYKSIFKETKTQEERFMKAKKNINKNIEKSTEVNENIESSDAVGDTDTINNSTEVSENIESSDAVGDTDTINNSTEVSENIESSDTVGDTNTIDNSTEVNENFISSDNADDTDTIDNSQAMICMDTIELMNLPTAEIGVDALRGRDTDIESQM